MPVRSLTKDPKTLTMRLVADFPVPIERVWAAWADPRQLERFWGRVREVRDAIVIGSGAGGLGVAALLAKLAHKRVVVLERYDTPTR
jgi:uncharacterized protein YndB with AHSA1/START domain